MPGLPDSQETSPSSLERVVFFSDAVFAIVITLLVLPLTAEFELPRHEGGTASQVWEMWPNVLSFVISFLVIGQFWIAHHRMFAYVRRVDHGLLWLNLVNLLTVSFLPFPTAVLGSRPTAADNFPVVFYAASMTGTSVMLTVTWLYALRRQLVSEFLPPSEAHAFSLRAVATSAVFLASIAAAFFGLPAAVFFWLVLLPVVRIGLSRRGRS